MVARVSERAARIADVRTRILEQEGAGPPILLIHGFADSADTWRPLMREMSGDGRALVAVDLPLFGRAGRPERRPVMDLLDEFTRALLDEVAADGDVLVVGNSLGGLLAMRAAQRSGAPIRAIAPIGPAGLGLQPWLGAVEVAAGALTVAAHSPIPLWVLQRTAGELYKALSASRPVDARAVEDFTSHIGRGDPARLFALARHLFPELRGPGVVELERIACPVLLIWGGKDRLCPPRGAAAVTSRLPHARLELLPKHGHCVQIEDPALVRRLILDLDARTA